MDVWMTHLTEALTNVPLYDLAIPGSHDSGAFNLTSTVATSAPFALHGLSWIPGFSTLIATIMTAMSTCQTQSIGQQLEHGIRFLDFRLSWWKNDFYFVHSVYGTKVSLALDEMKAFLTKHPKEVVILNIQRFDEMGPDEHKKLIAKLKSTFGTKFCQRMDLDKLTLKYLWDNNKQIICIYKDSEKFDDKYLWSESLMTSQWPDSSDVQNVIKKLTTYMNEATAITDKFSVCQAVVTPGTATIISHLVTDRSLKTMTSEFNPEFMKWLADSPNHWDNRPNIVIHDFVELDDFVRNVLDLNKNRIPKASTSS